jgi:GAF domain-containing protein
MTTGVHTEDPAIAILTVINSALDRRAPPEELFQETVEALARNLKLKAALLEIRAGGEETEPRIFEAGTEDSRRLLKRVRGERMGGLFELFSETIGFRADKVSFSIRSTPPLTVKAFKIISGRDNVAQLSLLVGEEETSTRLVEEFVDFLSSHLGLLWPAIHGGELTRPVQVPLHEQLRGVGLDPQKLLQNLFEEAEESLKPELLLLAFAPDGKEFLRTLAHPDTVLEENPLLKALPTTNSSFGEVLSSTTPLLRRYRKETITTIDDKLFTEIGLKSGMIVPVVSGEETLALLFVGSRTMEEYVGENARFLQALAGEAAETIESIVTFVGLKDSFEDVKRRYEDMVRAEKIKSIVETAVTINHEINNPLMAILGNTQLLLLRRESLEPELVEKLKLIEKSCLRIQTVTQKLMAMAEPKATYYTEGRRMVDINGSNPPEGESW